jgi:hypothetical protein
MPDNPVATPAVSTPPTVAPSKTAEVTASGQVSGDVVEPWLIGQDTTTNPSEPSETKPAAQGLPEESKPSPAKTEPPDVEKLVNERVEAERRRLQGERDRQVYQDRLRAQAEAQAALQQQLAQAAEQKRLTEMDDESFGKEVRDRTKAEQERLGLWQQAQQDATLNWVNTIRQIADRKLPDGAKPEFQQRQAPGAPNQFQSFEEMVDFIVDSRMKQELPKALKDKEKAIREAIEKERTAKEAETEAPVLDSGSPFPSNGKASSEENILAGIIELQAKKRR